ncbi:MAG: tetratricopeptide repeat protein [Anaerolineae bacterium]|jgi:tetratricopeptide (TPR) repeat protein|nr:tetratricopeptide repeat protein [Anaerolineae bacterium]
MTPPSTSPQEREPAPEFNAAGLDFIERWERGELPVLETVAGLNALAREAADRGQLANQARAEHLLGYIEHYRGNLSTSILHYDRARRLYEQVGNTRRVAAIDLNQGENYRNRGEFTRARRLYHAAYEAAVRLNDVALQALALTNQGLIEITQKDYGRARASLEKGLDLTEALPRTDKDEQRAFHALRCEQHQGLATLDLLARQPAAAWEQARRALEHARRSGQAISTGYAYRILGDVLTELPAAPVIDSPATPDDYYRLAMEAFRAVNAEGELGRTLYAHALSLARRSKRRAAAGLFREAMVIFTRLGMTDDAARAAEAQLKVIQTGSLQAD